MFIIIKHNQCGTNVHIIMYYIIITLLAKKERKKSYKDNLVFHKNKKIYIIKCDINR